MLSEIVKILVVVLSLCFMFIGNRKVRIFSIFAEQINVFRNDKKNKISGWDILCFNIMPILLSVDIVIGYERVIDETLAGVLTTVFAFIFTVLFGFAAILVGKMKSKNDIEKQVVNETIVSIMSANILSLISAILSITIIIAKNELMGKVLSILIYSFAFFVIMLLLMISKRTFLIYFSSK